MPIKPRGKTTYRPKDRAPRPYKDRPHKDSGYTPPAMPSEPPEGVVRIYGVHPVEAALANPARRIRKLYATDNAARRIADALSGRGLAPEPVSPRDLDRILGADTVHQGLLLETEPLDEPDLDTLAEAAVAGGPIVILDQVTDPHNAGAILRSSAVFGASGVVMTRRHSPPLTGTLAKSASGALELIPIALVQNLARTLADLKSKGVRIVGLDGEAETLLDEERFAGPTAIVLGAEGKGLRQLTRETCDAIRRIGTAGPLASLNVSNAAAVALHLAAMRRAGR